MRENGTVFTLRCSPEAKGDPELQRLCGFEGAVTTSTYDGTGKLSCVQTWKDGVLQKESPGTSESGSHREVSFKDGKEHGVERIFSDQGKLASTVTWDRGIKDGKESVYSDDGKKVVKEMLWKADELKQVTELYLNGNAKLKETYVPPRPQMRDRLTEVPAAARPRR
jgi:antitoxin component YwqK of YwqJK toxin-antitoxin module